MSQYGPNYWYLSSGKPAVTKVTPPALRTPRQEQWV